MSEQKQVTISQIREDLKNGLDRKAIKKKYGIVGQNANDIFNHPKLKGLRVNKAAANRVILVDDTDEGVDTEVIPSTNGTSESPAAEVANAVTEAPVAEQPLVAETPAPQAEEVQEEVIPTQPVVAAQPVAETQDDEDNVETSKGMW